MTQPRRVRGRFFPRKREGAAPTVRACPERRTAPLPRPLGKPRVDGHPQLCPALSSFRPWHYSTNYPCNLSTLQVRAGIDGALGFFVRNGMNRTKSIYSVVIILMLIETMGHPSRAQSTPSSTYIRNTSADRVIVFVHGFLGDSISTWTNDQSYWPRMLIDDQGFNGVDVFVYQYPTSVNANLTPTQIADDMRAVLKSYGVSDKKELIFLSHDGWRCNVCVST